MKANLFHRIINHKFNEKQLKILQLDDSKLQTICTANTANPRSPISLGYSQVWNIEKRIINDLRSRIPSTFPISLTGNCAVSTATFGILFGPYKAESSVQPHLDTAPSASYPMPAHGPTEETSPQFRSYL